NRILNTSPTPPTTLRPDLDPRIEAICLKMLAKRGQDRYATMGDLIEALTEYLHPTEVEVPVPGWWMARRKGGILEQALLILLLPALDFLGRGGLLFEDRLLRGVAAGRRMAAPGLGRTTQEVAGDGEQPAAKGPAAGIVAEARQRRVQGAEDVLRQIGGIGVLQSVPPGHAIDQRRVQVDELHPRLVILSIAQAEQQADARLLGIPHPLPPSPTIHPRTNPFPN